MRVTIFDSGAGNMHSLAKALSGGGTIVAAECDPLRAIDTDVLVLPGVGNFGAAAERLAPARQAMRDAIMGGLPTIGICLGMQLLFEGSDEAPDVPGLGLFGGRCYRLSGAQGVKIPHVGWNSLDKRMDGTIADGVVDGAQVYFTHSFVAPITSETVASTDHGEPFSSIVQRGQVAGVQFHPEKSGEVGLRVLRNFLESAD